jgi:hypothetical protein
VHVIDRSWARAVQAAIPIKSAQRVDGDVRDDIFGCSSWDVLYHFGAGGEATAQAEHAFEKQVADAVAAGKKPPERAGNIYGAPREARKCSTSTQANSEAGGQPRRRPETGTRSAFAGRTPVRAGSAVPSRSI